MQLVHGKSSVGLVGSFRDIIRQEGCVHNSPSALIAVNEPNLSTASGDFIAVSEHLALTLTT